MGLRDSGIPTQQPSRPCAVHRVCRFDHHHARGQRRVGVNWAARGLVSRSTSTRPSSDPQCLAWTTVLLAAGLGLAHKKAGKPLVHTESIWSRSSTRCASRMSRCRRQTLLEHREGSHREAIDQCDERLIRARAGDRLQRWSSAALQSEAGPHTIMSRASALRHGGRRRKEGDGVGVVDRAGRCPTESSTRATPADRIGRQVNNRTVARPRGYAASR